VRDDPSTDLPPDPADEPPGPPSPGHLEPVSGSALTLWAVAGLVSGWLLHPVSERFMDAAPVISWVQPVALLAVLVVVATAAWSTWRTVQVRHEHLEPHRAVNRFVLGRATALVGALVAGGYVGYAVSWLGVDAALAHQRIWRSLACALVGVGILVAGVLLERACRVRQDDDEG
jgi:Protein of unknown function (DUF3180)